MTTMKNADANTATAINRLPEPGAVRTPAMPPGPESAGIGCDVPALLEGRSFEELEAQLCIAQMASFESRSAEARYTDTLNEGLAPVLRRGPAGLALLREWQAALPQSGHAHLCEAHYWFHWAYEYRGSGWASSVSESMWACAHATIVHMAASVLQALHRSPRLWAAPALMMQGTAAFQEPEWLTHLMQRGTLPAGPVRLNLPNPGESQQDLVTELARSGLSPEACIEVPPRPEGMLPTLQGRKHLKQFHYWMRAALHLHPRLFFCLKTYVWFLQPRWGGSHEHIHSFIASADCAHLSAVEKDRLAHEVWRDDYLHNLASPDNCPEDVASWLHDTVQRAEQALWPYHRQEAMVWLARSNHLLGRFDDAFAWLKKADEAHPISDDDAMGLAIELSCRLEPESGWLAHAVERSAKDKDGCHSARILYGYFASHGFAGVQATPAVGKAWLDLADRNEPRSAHWIELALVFRRMGLTGDFFRLVQLGYERGAPNSAFYMGYAHAEGIHVAANTQLAMRYYTEGVEAGGSTSAYNLSKLHSGLARSGKDAATARADRGHALNAMLKAHELGDEDALHEALVLLTDDQAAELRRRHLPWLREQAQQGHATAMAALSSLLADPKDKELFNYRESVRWLMGAQMASPDLDFIATVIERRHTGLLRSMRYELTRGRIRAHEIPGGDNALI